MDFESPGRGTHMYRSGTTSAENSGQIVNLELPRNINALLQEIIYIETLNADFL